MAKKLGLKTTDLVAKLLFEGHLEDREGKNYLTEKGKSAGGEFRMGQFGPYFLWPEGLVVEMLRAE